MNSGRECRIAAESLELGGEKAGIAPREGFEAEIEDPVEFVERDAHVEADFGGGEAVAAGFLHDGKAIEVKPADGVWVDFFDGGLLLGFETLPAGGCRESTGGRRSQPTGSGRSLRPGLRLQARAALNSVVDQILSKPNLAWVDAGSCLAESCGGVDKTILV